MSLKKYNKKRNFSATDEPFGKITKSKLKRFVIQYHKARKNHYDFRLEYQGVLLSWAIPKGISNNPKDKRLAIQVEDHPLDYIDFEGIIPSGNYGAGSVDIFDFGDYIPLENLKNGLKKGHLKFILNGNKIKGTYSLIKMEDNNWLIIKIDDEFVNRKQKSNLTQIKNITPQLAKLANKIPKGNDWIYEIKYDGYRIIAYFENNKIKLLSRNNKDYTKKFKNISSSLLSLNHDSFVLDGEIVSFDKKGKSDFGLLQQNIKEGNKEFYYIIFDLLVLDGDDLRNLPLKKRKDKLERLLYKTSEYLIFSKHVTDGEKCFKFAKENNLEGIIAKRIDSIYEGKRSDDWQKIKCYQRQEFIVVGYTTSSKNKELSALLLGYYDEKDLVYVGKVGTGFNLEKRKELNNLFKNSIRKKSPFKEDIKVKNVIWLKLKFIAEIQFAELTKDKHLRQPSFIALRIDKKVDEVILESKNEEN